MTAKNSPTNIPALFQAVGSWMGKKAKEFQEGFAEGRASARRPKEAARSEPGPGVV